MGDRWQGTVRGAGLGGAAAASSALLIAYGLRCFTACAPVPGPGEIASYFTLAGTASTFLLAATLYGRGVASPVLFSVAGLLSAITMVTTGLFLLALGVLLAMLGVMSSWPVARPKPRRVQGRAEPPAEAAAHT